MNSEVKYFNFPIELLEGFLEDRKKCLHDILCYALYFHADSKLTEGDIEERIESAGEFYYVSVGDPEGIIKRGSELNLSIPDTGPKVGLSTEIYWDFRDNFKTEFEEVCLLAFLALKSIVQNHPFCKVTNLYWLSRMDGNRKSVAADFELSDKILKYSKEYQLKKIKYELSESWNLVYYGRYTRGFYISFKMSLDELIYQVEKKRKSRKVKQQQEKQKAAYKKALIRLESEQDN